MKRKVALSKATADEIVELQTRAESRGDKRAFRRAWIKIWKALNERPLPPDDHFSLFGELRYRTRHSPHHFVCIGSIRPLAVRFAVCEEPIIVDGESVQVVTVLKVILLG